MIADPRMMAVDAWRAYVAEHQLATPTYKGRALMHTLGYLDGARALLAYAEAQGDVFPRDHAGIAAMRVFVEELRRCYCDLHGYDPDAE